jgi:hypothetical protein
VSSREGLVRGIFFESVSYDPMLEAAKALQTAIENRKYDEVQSLQRDLHVPVAQIKLEVRLFSSYLGRGFMLFV